MSINHHYSPETTPWWTQQQQPQDAEEEEEEDDVVLEENTNTNTKSPPQEEEEQEDEKEAMFEKPLTPSDVGKLNRLVIPKQHAERYFPLDSAGESKGLLLSFEDESGKCWRFRYSYWNSSQSYVLTKGWSRYVKDKRLDAGDVVLFHRHRSLSQRFFITWRRRQSTTPKAHVSNSNVNGWTNGLYPAHPYPTPHHHHHHHHPLPYQTHDYALHAGGGSQSRIVAGGNSSSSSTSSSSSRVLRLFGVNMECQPDNNNNIDSQTYNNNNMLSTQGTATPQFYHQHLHSQSSNPQNHFVVRQQPY